MSIQLQNIQKKFGDFVAVDQVNLHIGTGQLTALLGPSGSGKTSLLRIIAGLEQADSGQVWFHGQDISERHVSERGVGFVFQHYALFKHMTVFENVAFGLTVKPKKLRPSEAQIRNKVQHLLELVQLDWTASRYPSQLSGGQRQRIALARALAVEPQVLLLDEPFGALDAKVRAELRRWLRRLHDEIHVTSVFVTHDQEEALEVADQIVVMNKGRIEQQGSPEQVYDHPANPFVYEFLGNVNLFHARIKQGAVQLSALSTPQTQQHELAYVRPHEIDVLLQAEPGGISAVVDLITIVGPTVRLEVLAEENRQLIQVELAKDKFKQLGLSQHQQIWLKPQQSRIFLGEGI
ncbi:sulfate ABC transporter ATP-binding protein [Rheinheimera sp.]|uniref:sulfate/molybdate ABC transporter ATP-binding protein n=1 Tax=Rheinheimera sp. TaxID=1869214 RepID=UPI00307EA060